MHKAFNYLVNETGWSIVKVVNQKKNENTKIVGLDRDSHEAEAGTATKGIYEP